MNDTLSILKIVHSTIVDGPGLRTSIYGAGCMNHCCGCHNPQSWDISAGKPMKIDDIVEDIIGQIGGVTFSGGDPFFQAEGFTLLARKIKQQTDKDIWCYSGLTFEEICENELFAGMLPYLDVLVDGRFIEALKSDDAIFRGSSNQRLIDIPRSLQYGHAVEIDYNPIPKICRKGS